jgi:beta-lactamase regulating signal transducer with metallopeptidase domain
VNFTANLSVLHLFALRLNTMNLDGMAAAASARLLYSAVAGTLLAIAVWFVLQMFPKRDSRTSFVVWFSTLLATAILPLLGLQPKVSAAAGASQAVLTVSSSWAWYVFLGWATIAFAGLARVAFATWHVRRLRAEAAAVDMQKLNADLRILVEEFQQSRRVDLLVSRTLDVPTAIGFRKAAIILPAWLLESTPAEELKYIVLHELAHLARRDDWTNLAQKVLKAIFFFLPSVWWIERKLSLDREMACDDAVIARSGTPRAYAECLAHVAERSFLRRHLAMAQAAVGRVRQLTARVARILDPNRPRATQVWKPAIPVVIVLAGLSALPASLTPQLVHFADSQPKALSAQSGSVAEALRPVPAGQPIVAAQPAVSASSKISGVTAVRAYLRTTHDGTVAGTAKSMRPAQKNSVRAHLIPVNKTLEPPALAASVFYQMQPHAQQEYVTVREDLVVMVTQTASGEQQSWQMHVVQLSLQPQTKPVIKPRKT